MLTGQPRVNRLRWLCRRGMKEMDLMFEAFLLREEQSLADGAWPALEELLQLEDDVLWDCLQGRAVAPERAQQELIVALRGGVTTGPENGD